MGIRLSWIRRGVGALAIAVVSAAFATMDFPSPPPSSSSPDQGCDQCPVARQGLDLLMNGDPDRAIEVFNRIQAQEPDSPFGDLLAADALWWKIYLTTSNLVDPDVFDVVYSNSSPYDAAFEALVDKTIRKAADQIHLGRNVARNQLYEGLAYALRARYHGLRDEDLATARAGKKMRALLIAASQDDPSLIDADAGLGLYNYFVDTLPTIIKMLKFFIGLPGGSREVGLQQLQNAATHGDLVRAEAKFYLAKDFSRPSEQQYAASLRLFQELSKEYPRNSLWRLLMGSLEARLGRAAEADAVYRAVLEKSAGENSEIPKALHREADKALQRLHPERKVASMVR